MTGSPDEKVRRVVFDRHEPANFSEILRTAQRVSGYRRTSDPSEFLGPTLSREPVPVSAPQKLLVRHLCIYVNFLRVQTRINKRAFSVNGQCDLICRYG